MSMEGLMDSIRRAYSTGVKPIDMGAVVKQSFMQHDELEKYRYAIESVREQEFLKMISVDSENMVLEQYQLKAKDMYDKFMDDNTQLWKTKKRVLSTEDKMKVLRSQQDVQSQLNTMKAKAKQFVDVKDALARDGGVRYDEWMMKGEMDAFVKDPINNPVPTLKARPVNLEQYIVENAPKWKPDATDEYVEIGKGQYEVHKKKARYGIENVEDYREWLNNFLKHDQKAGYAFNTPYYNRDIDGIIERTKDEVIPYTFEKKSVSSSYYFGSRGGSNGTVGYSNLYDAQLGETINITGKLAPFTLNVDGDRKTVVVKAIGEKGIKVDYTETIPDTSYEGLDFSKANNPYAEAEARYSKPIQDKNGLWYPSKTESRDRVIGKDDAELGQYYDEIEKAIRAGENTNSNDFLKAFGIFKGNVAKGKKAVTSQPKKDEKKKGVQGSFFN